MSQHLIPFTCPDVSQADIGYVVNLLRSGAVRGNGPVTNQVQIQMGKILGVRHVLLVTFCSHAIELALMALGIAPGDEIILPSFAFVSAATAVIRQGGKPVFAEIDESTFNLDPEDVARRITARTRAIVPIHYAGQGCQMNSLMELARRHGLWVVEDAAQAIGAR